MSIRAFVKYIFLNLIKFAVRLLYGFFRLIRRPSERIVFISRQSSTPSGAFVLLGKELARLAPNIELCFSCRLGLKGSMGLSYIPLLIKQLWLLAGARACVTESYCPPISLPKHHGSTKIIQIWHSMVAIKQFGWQTVGRPEGSDEITAKVMCMHSGYDAVICGSEFQRSFFAEAMRTSLEKIHPLGVVGEERLTDAAADPAYCGEVRAKYHEHDGKRLIAYLPTMRRGHGVPWEQLAETLPKDCILLIGLHPLDSFTCRRVCENVIFEQTLSSRQLMLGCDAVISDYSGAAAEAALCGRELYFFVPDIDEYSADCGLNIDPRVIFPSICASSGEEMADMLGRPYPDEMKAVCRELLAGGCDGNSTERIARLILE